VNTKIRRVLVQLMESPYRIPMKLAPREAFLAGHNIAYTATYFDQVLFAARMANHNTKESLEHSNKMVQMLKTVGANFASRMKHINLIAKEANLPERTLPSLPPEFYPWANLVHKDFLELWTVLDPAGCFFAIGHSLGEFRNGAIILNLSLDFHTNLKLDCSKEICDIPIKLGESIQRWTVANEILNNNQMNSTPAQILSLLESQSKTIANLAKDSQKGWKLIPKLLHVLIPLLAKAEVDIIQALPSITDRY
jgi:hypothetical protein